MTKQEIAEAQRLANWAEALERDGLKTSIYYRLQPQIIEARKVVARSKEPSHG